MIFFVSRHPGALAWMRASGPAFDQHVPHLDPATVNAGDTVIGTLPINLIADVCKRGAQYLHLTLEMPVDMRGRELTPDDMTRLSVRLEGFTATKT